MGTPWGRAFFLALATLTGLVACETEPGPTGPLADTVGNEGVGGDVTGTDTITPGGPCAYPGAQGSVVHALVSATTQADVDALAGCTEIGGLQIVGTSDVTNLDALASLTHVREWDDVVVSGTLLISGNTGLIDGSGLGNLRVVEWGLSVMSNPVLRQINLPALEQVGTLDEVSSGLAIQSNAAATLLDLGALTTVVNGFSIIGNTALAEVRLGSLRSVTTRDGDLNVSQNALLPALRLPSLVSLEGHLTLNNNAALDTVEAPLLAAVDGWVGVSGNANLYDLSLPALASPVDAVVVTDNEALGSVSMPSLPSVLDKGWDDTMSEGNLEIGGNAVLGALDFGALTRIDGSLQIHDNPSLPTADAEDLKTQVETAGGVGAGASVWGNGD